MTRELQWDIKAQAFKGISQRSYAEDSSNLPFDEHGFYFIIKYGLDGVVTERYYALQPGDLFAKEAEEDPGRISVFKSIPRREISATDYYISYKARPFTYLDKHPEISVNSELLAVSSGLIIRYNTITKETLVYYVYVVDSRCAALIDTSDNAAYLRLDAEFNALVQRQTAELEKFKSFAGSSIRQNFGVDSFEVIILAPGIYSYVSFWNDDILKNYLEFWNGQYVLPTQIYNV
jgi:hypothetical protein